MDLRAFGLVNGTYGTNGTYDGTGPSFEGGANYQPLSVVRFILDFGIHKIDDMTSRGLLVIRD